LIQHVLIFYLSLELLKISILSIFSKDLLSSSEFALRETFKTNNKKQRMAIIGNKLIMENLYEIKNKYKKQKTIERIITDFLKTPIIEKECINKLNKFI